jgi:hypothetical protein
MAGESRAVTERIVQDALEERVKQIMLPSQTNAVDAQGSQAFVPRFVASTMLALVAWSLEQAETPPPAKLQSLYRSLVGRALEVAV